MMLCNTQHPGLLGEVSWGSKQIQFPKRYFFKDLASSTIGNRSIFQNVTLFLVFRILEDGLGAEIL